jgi:hypothetical protein
MIHMYTYGTVHTVCIVPYMLKGLWDGTTPRQRDAILKRRKTVPRHVAIIKNVLSVDILISCFQLSCDQSRPSRSLWWSKKCKMLSPWQNFQENKHSAGADCLMPAPTNLCEIAPSVLYWLQAPVHFSQSTTHNQGDCDSPLDR